MFVPHRCWYWIRKIKLTIRWTH